MNMSVTETVKSISSIIKRNVDPTMLFDKDSFAKIIDIAREKKRKHTEVFNLLESREGDLWNCREAEQERRKVISDLEMKVWKLKSCFTEKNANMSSKENLLQFLVSSVEQKKEQKELYKIDFKL
ncbi:unnamed protein product [Heterobilharzia americana]|nr:unnamed protein product [Heterobilharzia americana]